MLVHLVDLDKIPDQERSNQSDALRVYTELGLDNFVKNPNYLIQLSCTTGFTKDFMYRLLVLLAQRCPNQERLDAKVKTAFVVQNDQWNTAKMQDNYDFCAKAVFVNRTPFQKFMFSIKGILFK